MTQMPTVKVEGAEKLALLGKAVRKMGSDRTILNNLTKRIRGSLPAVREQLKASALEVLPKKGGLNKWVAKARVTVSVKRGSNTAGVEIKAGRNSKGARSDLNGADSGLIRHPLFGINEFWYAEPVTPEFGTRVLQGPAGDTFTEATEAAIDDAIAEVLRGI